MLPEFLRTVIPSLFHASRPGEQQSEKDDAPLDNRPILDSAKRAADHSGTSAPAPSKRARRLQVSSEEKRLVPGYQNGHPHATPISIPRNEWTAGRENLRSDMSRPRKIVSGGFKPTNTLHKNTFTPAKGQTHVLDTTTTSGDNVTKHTRSTYFDREPSPKRRKIEQPNRLRAQSEEEAIVISEDADIFRRAIASSPVPASRGREPSFITIDSQGSGIRDARLEDLFVHNESRDVHRFVAPRQKGRKPKSSSDSSSHLDRSEVIEIPDSQPSQQAEMRPPARKSVEKPPNSKPITVDGDAVQIVIDYSPTTQRNLRAAKARQIPTTTQQQQQRQESAIRIERVKGQFDNLASTQDPTATWRASETTQASPKNQHSRATTPPLRKSFVRDETSSASKGSLRKNMLADSCAPAQAEHVDDSEDELAPGFMHPIKGYSKGQRPKAHGSPSDPRRAPASASKRGKVNWRSSSWDDFESGGEQEMLMTFRLKAITTQSLSCEERDLCLEYYPAEKSFSVCRGRDSVLAPERQGKDRYLLTSKHMRNMLWNPDITSQVQITGASDETTGGDIWLEFVNSKDLTKCVEIFRSITRSKLNEKKLDHYAIEKSFGSSRAKFEYTQNKHNTKHNENLATVNRAVGARERTRGLQKGVVSSLSKQPVSTSGTTATTRKAAMQSDFSDKKLASEPTTKPHIEGSVASSQSAMRSSRRLQFKDTVNNQAEPILRTWTEKHGVPTWDGPLTYPATGPKRTTVDAQDIQRLDEGEFLNDNIISFCLRQMEESNPQLKDKVHIFNSFFYTTLSTKQGKKVFNYDAVKKWTKNMDIFTYPFIVVPVNANLHWFVTIICNLDKLERRLPGEDILSSPLPYSSGIKDDGMLDNRIEKDNDLEERLPMELPDSQEEQKTESVRDKVHHMSISDHEGESGGHIQHIDDGIFDVSSPAEPTQPSLRSAPASARKGKRAPPPLPKIDPNQPVVITLDSLGTQHSLETRHLKDYVVQEGEERRGMSIERGQIRGVLARGVPEQTNFCDCGVYLVGYITEFLKNPEEFVRKVMSRELDRDNDFADFDPSKKRAEIRDELIRLEKEQVEAKRRLKKAKRDAREQEQRGAQDLPREDVKTHDTKETPIAKKPAPNKATPRKTSLQQQLDGPADQPGTDERPLRKLQEIVDSHAASTTESLSATRKGAARRASVPDSPDATVERAHDKIESIDGSRLPARSDTDGSGSFLAGIEEAASG